ncbi:uncharacterized protein C8orf59 homolog [Tupaia chinensis]|uniref:uncharacterized protein C8orf59 homolog n=1 Tax=Tupaia chinensis TaxID=246437 RepID=UPI000FFB63BC|nr:uncharacterized protein C8orf59 homolog [Tupaia chinensis]
MIKIKQSHNNRVVIRNVAKNKFRGQKSRNVFHIASKNKQTNKQTKTNKTKKTNFKAKNKAKPVTTNLKINIKDLIPQRHLENEPVNVDEATRLKAQL